MLRDYVYAYIRTPSRSGDPNPPVHGVVIGWTGEPYIAKLAACVSFLRTAERSPRWSVPERELGVLGHVFRLEDGADVTNQSRAWAR